MTPHRPRRRARTVLETTVVIIILGVLLSILMPVLKSSFDHSMETACGLRLRHLDKAIGFYCQDSRGGELMPATDPKGTTWFAKLEPLLPREAEKDRRDIFRCPKASPGFGDFTQAGLSYGWNELDVPWQSVKSKVPEVERDTMLLGDSLGAVLLTQDGTLRMDLRHRGGGQALFLDGHFEMLYGEDAVARAMSRTRGSAESPGPAITLAEQPVREAVPVLGLAWYWWPVIGLGAAVPYFLFFGGPRYWREWRKAQAAKERKKAEEEERATRAEEEQEHEAKRREYLKGVPSGPIEAGPDEIAALHVGNRRYRLEPTRELTIGRGERVHVRIRDDSVSREHAKIRPEPDGYVLYDLYSRTGTHVGGKEVRRKVLANGDTIRVGHLNELVFEMRKS